MELSCELICNCPISLALRSSLISSANCSGWGSLSEQYSRVLATALLCIESWVREGEEGARSGGAVVGGGDEE